MVRNSLRYVTWKEYKAVTAYLKLIYKSATEAQALQALDGFAEKWTMPIRDWKPALNRFIIDFGDRLEGHI